MGVQRAKRGTIACYPGPGPGRMPVDTVDAPLPWASVARRQRTMRVRGEDRRGRERLAHAEACWGTVPALGHPPMRLLLLAPLCLGMFGCSDAPREPERTWRPSDHGVPPSLRALDEQESARAALPPQHPPVDDPRANPDVATTLFRVMCAECHGASGRGDGPKAMGSLPDFSDLAWQRRTTDARIAEVVRNGSPRGMPAFGERLAPAAIEALVRHVRSFGRSSRTAPAAGANAAEGRGPEVSEGQPPSPKP